MKKSNVRKIIVLIIILIGIILAVMFLKESTAKKYINIEATISDKNEKLNETNQVLQAAQEVDSGYSIVLPETIGNFQIKKYIIKEKAIMNNENDNKIEQKADENSNINVENSEENVIQSVDNKAVDNNENEYSEKIPGDKIYLTKQETDSKKIDLIVEYDYKEKDDTILYNQVLEKKIEDNKNNNSNRIVTIKGYMPTDSLISIKEIEQDEVVNAVSEYVNKNTTIAVAYDIKIKYEETEYQPTQFDENVKVTISGVEKIDSKNQKYKIIHIADNKTEEINTVNVNEDELSFLAEEFSTYVILLENDSETSSINTLSLLATTGKIVDTWDGTTATSFSFGNGTEANPYLISSGAELAYLRTMVNLGTTYTNQYFQITNDINLNGNEWEPIGTYNQPFMGNMDGAGHTISNATITISTLATSVMSYGFFGSIGGGNYRGVIKNIEFNSIHIVLTASGRTANNTTEKGYRLGIVAGSMYKNSSIINVITNNCDITDTNTVTLYNYNTQVYVGGLVGYVANTSSSTSDPGTSSRYAIENCFSSTNIELDIALRSNTVSYAGQYNVGGIVGIIRTQPVWPSNCMYTGNVNATYGFTGPIFGVLRNNTGYTSTSYFATLWNGNDNGNLTMNSYYTNYSTNGSPFTTSVISGTSTTRKTSTTNNIGSVQGVNKGIYTDSAVNMLTNFNNYAGSSYATWSYDNGTYSFLKHISAYVTDNEPNYTINVQNDYSTTNYTYNWYINDELNANINGNTSTLEKSLLAEKKVQVIVKDGEYYSLVNFVIEKLTLYIEFNINNTNKSVVGTLAGNAMPNYINLNDYTYEWYKEDITGLENKKVGEGLTLTGLESGQDYKLIAKNNSNSELTRENTFTFGNRIVIYVNNSSGNDSHDGLTSDTAVKTMPTAYSKINSSYSVVENIIVVMGSYTDTSYINSQSATTYNKQATLTGYFKGTDYGARLTFSGSKFLTNNTTLQYMTLYGGNSSVMFYAQGHDLTIGEQVIMNSYSNLSSDYGQITGVTTPDFHLIGAFLNYNLSSIPDANNNSTITIKSGTYGRIIAGCRSDADGANVSKNIFGTSSNPFNVRVVVDIKSSTSASQYGYDVNLLVGGQTDGSVYANVNLDVKSGNIGRVLGGSIGNTRTYSGYPANSFFGSSNITVSGGQIKDIFGTSLGRNKNDTYYYGKVKIEISGGTINSNIYGAGAGAVTGYNSSSTDPYKSYGQNYETETTINVTGGNVNGNIYGAGYGYSAYLTDSTISLDGGALYGNSHINISGGIINGNIYGAGKGYSGYSNKNALAKMIGNTDITISGTPNITGNVYGAAEGITGYSETAKLTGNTTVNINTNLGINVYGGSNIAEMNGNTNVNINSGTQTGSIYGGGNLGLVNGTANVYINSGNIKEVYGGGQSSDANTTRIYIQGGQTTDIYGGSNVTGTVYNSNISATAGTVTNIYGGNNTGGSTNNSNVTVNGTSVAGAVFGGGNHADTSYATVILTNTGNTIPNVYAGGNMASVTNTYLYCNGGNITNIYGGSNTSGNVTTSSVNINGGTIYNAFGGNNEGGKTVTSTVMSNWGTVTNAIYGGGRQAETQITNVTLNGLANTVPSVYGGGQSANANTTNINMRGASATKVFGGSNTSGTVTESNVSIYSGTISTIYGGNNSGGNTITTKVNVIGGTITNVFGGGQSANANITNLNISGGTTTNVFGGSNTSGTVTESNVLTNSGTINTVYGGNNSGGNTITTNVNIEGGNITDVYGGGNEAITSNTNVGVKSKVLGNVYGGGNAANVAENTNLHILNGVIAGNVYAGGNGITAVVNKNTNLTIEGETTDISGSVFGGGNQAATGTTNQNNSISTVNIVGGRIGGNVYGGANTSVVYGNAQVNIGYDILNNPQLKKGNINIEGTIFGGGEANASGSEVYDFSFISVTKGIEININANGHTNFNIKGSIFGSGNASSASGASYINIKNYGTASAPKKNISIQRATKLILDNSAMVLSGAKDRTNEYSSVYFSLSRIDELKIKNNSTLYLNCGANLLKKVTSLVDQNGAETKANVSINEETGETTKNVDNRIYLLEGKNLNIATNEQATAYGEIFGVTFLGIFTNAMSPNTSTGIYNYNYTNGEKVTNEGTFSTNAYVLAQHLENHNIKEDGFYSNYNNEGYIKAQYINTTPEEDVYYIWTIGEKTDVTIFEFSLTASKYATFGTYEMALTGLSMLNTKLVLTGFAAGLENDVVLTDSNSIEPIASTREKANSEFGLTMKTGNSGWQSRGNTNFLTEQGGIYTGDSLYYGENSVSTPSLMFCFYHSENLDIARTLGTVTIRFQAMTPIDDLTYKVSYVDINVTLNTALYQDDYYEAAITPGEQFGLFRTTETNITDSSMLSTYYSLYIPDFSETEYYEGYNTYKRALVSRDSSEAAYVLPVETKITMLDMVTNKHYYYVVSQDDVNRSKSIYYLSDFKAMGSIDKNYNESESISTYFNQNQDLVYENFIFHVDFSETSIGSNIVENKLLLELQESGGHSLIGVLGIHRDTMKYSVYKQKDATIKLNASSNKETVYLGDSFNLSINTNFIQNIISSKTIFDTKYFVERMGLKLTIYDSNNNRVNLDSLLGVTFVLNGTTYYPAVDGTVRIKIADIVSNVLSVIKVNTLNNKLLATGNYKIKLESFGSPDGVYYGLKASDTIEIPIIVINSQYGLEVSTDSQSKIIDDKTGITQNGNNSLITNIKYASGLQNPNITVSLYRRDYTSIYSQNYQLVDLADYITNVLTKTKRELEYVSIGGTPQSNNMSFLLLNTNLVTGTYKLVFKLYDKDTYIGEAYEYLIIK